ncbi:MAG TPA: phosphotransferase [Symbiobacteriaceae bacterium]|nr:phosphotransferase [Symbiobacteriaceae bacterium]
MQYIYSTCSGTALAQLLATEYDLPHPVTCRLLRRGYNDQYIVTAGDQRYVLRVYLHGKYWIRGEGDLRFELDMLDHLRSEGIGVACAIPRQNGERLGRLDAPEGLRHYALFTYAPGAPVATYDAASSRRLGETIARIHVASDRFVSPYSRYDLDLSMLIDAPIGRLAPFLTPEDLEFVKTTAEQVRGRLENAEASWGYIHGDMHGGNNFVAEDGSITVFDFDHSGFGWRAYDLAAFLWGAEPDIKESFLAGYQSVRVLTEAELDLLPTFITARAIWDYGDSAANVERWGTAAVERSAASMVKTLKELKA